MGNDGIWFMAGFLVGLALGAILIRLVSHQASQSSVEKILFERDEHGRIVGFAKVSA